MIKLIVSDIDGTLVPEGNTDLNPEYLEVIKKLTEKGIVFAAASGRHASSINAVFQPVSERIYYVSDNGACIEKNGKEERYILRRTWVRISGSKFCDRSWKSVEISVFSSAVWWRDLYFSVYHTGIDIWICTDDNGDRNRTKDKEKPDRGI